MAFSPIALTIPNYRDFKNHWIKAYVPSTTTPKVMASDKTGSPAVAKFELNTEGFPKTSGGALVIPYIDGLYDLWLFPTEAEADANDTSNALRLAINVAADSSSTEISAAFDRLNPDTLAIWQADANVQLGDISSIVERLTGSGGGSTGEVISGTGTANGDDRVAHGTLPLTWVQVDSELKAVAYDTTTVTVLIPTNFPDLQTAVDFYLNSKTKQNVPIELRIEAGHALTGGLGVYNADASNFVITSVDATVLLDAGFSGVQGVTQDAVNGEVPNPPLFYCFNGSQAQLKTVIDMNNKAGTGSGYFGVNSKGFIHLDCGVINAGFRGLQWRNGYCWAARTKWSGANGAGIRLHQTAHVNAFNTNVDDCCKTTDLTLAAVYVSRSSSLEFRDSTALNSGANGMLIRRSIVTARGVDCSGATLNGLHAESSAIVDAIELTANGSGEHGIKCGFGTIVAAHTAFINPSTLTAIKVEAGGNVSINDLTRTPIGFPTDAGVEVDYEGIDFFNVQTGDGIVVSQNSPPSMAVAESGGNRSVRHADGTQTVEISTTLAHLNSTELFSVVTFPQSFLAVDGYSVSVCLPSTTGKWGTPADRSNVNFSGWSTRNTSSVTIVLNGSGFTASSSVTDVLVTCIGRWK